MGGPGEHLEVTQQARGPPTLQCYKECGAKVTECSGWRTQELEQETNKGTHIGEKRQPTKASQQPCHTGLDGLVGFNDT